MSEVSITISQDIWVRTYNALQAAKDNAIEVYNNHMTNNGDVTKRNKCVADMYLSELKELDELMSYARENGAVPF